MSGDDRPLRISIDPSACIGSGICELIAPDRIEVDEDTSVASLIVDEPMTAGRARELVDRCPSRAIAIDD